MGGGSHGDEYFVPDYKIYSDWKKFPHMAAHAKRLEKLGLKDPWIRNHVWKVDYRQAYVQKWTYARKLLTRGWREGLAAAALLICIEESYTYWKYGHTSWGEHH